MRNYSNVTNNDSFFLVPANNMMNTKILSRIRNALMLTLETTEFSFTPSEERVIISFFEWATSVSDNMTQVLVHGGTYSYSPCFSYHNINTGKSVIVVAVDQGYDGVVYPAVL